MRRRALLLLLLVRRASMLVRTSIRAEDAAGSVDCRLPGPREPESRGKEVAAEWVREYTPFPILHIVGTASLSL